MQVRCILRRRVTHQRGLIAGAAQTCTRRAAFRPPANLASVLGGAVHPPLGAPTCPCQRAEEERFSTWLCWERLRGDRLCAFSFLLDRLRTAGDRLSMGSVTKSVVVSNAKPAAHSHAAKPATGGMGGETRHRCLGGETRRHRCLGGEPAIVYVGGETRHGFLGGETRRA